MFPLSMLVALADMSPEGLLFVCDSGVFGEYCLASLDMPACAIADSGWLDEEKEGSPVLA